MRLPLLAGTLLCCIPAFSLTENDRPMPAVPSYLVPSTLPAPLRAEVEAGRFAEAENWIDATLAKAPDAALTQERERLKRLRRDYSVDAAGLLEKLGKQIPDVTQADLDRWRAAGELQSLVIDGQLRYFRREPSNLFRFSKDALARRDAAAKAATPSAPAGDPAAAQSAASPFVLEEHLADVLREADFYGEKEVLRQTFKVHHKITVKPGMVPPGEVIRCWMPFPQDYRQQMGGTNLTTTPPVKKMAPVGATHRTIYMEQPAAAAGDPTVFEAEYEYSTAAYTQLVNLEKVRPTDTTSGELAPYLAEQAPHIRLTPEIRALAKEIVGDEQNPYRKAENIFRWMDTNIKYASEMEYCVMPSIIDKVATERKGDCGVHVIMFVSLCRAAGVPARWQSGWVTRPGHWNMHDWAEFHVAPYGWLPADPSMGLRKSDNPQVRDFYFGNTDVYRMIANVGIDGTFDPPKEHWRSDPVDSQRGEVEWKGGNLYYDEWEYEVTVEPTGEREVGP